MKVKKTLIAALLAASTLAARADFLTGQTLENLLVSNDAGDLWMATGYVAGIIDMAHASQSGKVYCSPAGGATLQQVTAIVKKYLAENPATWHKNAKVLVLEAVAKAFPCKR